ncbi:MAG TPA: porin [candidate division Zixibacteria bacterium]|nr:porin [candidate division Zixibacteria bacterium]
MNKNVLMIIIALAALLSIAGQSTAAVGPFRITGADSSYLEFHLATQVQLKYIADDLRGDDGYDDRFTMELRRVRPAIAVGLPKKHLTFRLQLSTVSGSLELLDLYSDYSYRKNLRFRIGQFKTPFTRYRLQSFQSLTFVDWSVLTRWFGAERQRGLAIHNGFTKPAPFSYVVMFGSGVNARASHAIGTSLVYDLPRTNPSDLTESAAGPEFHPELFVHLAHHHGNINVGSDTDASRTGLRYMTAVSFAWDMDPDPYYDCRLRLAPELLVKYSGWALSAIGYGATGEIYEGNDHDPILYGGLLQAAYRIDQRWELAARFAAADASDNFYRGAVNKALADDEERTILRSQRQATIGLNVYIDEHICKLQTDFGWLRNYDSEGSTDDYEIRSQLQLTF